jgi:site-specific recombinase XerD
MNKNQKLVALKIPEKVLPILEQYKPSQKRKNDFVFPEMKKANMKDANDVLTKTQTATRKFNRHLKNIAKTVGIDKNISCHLARHSFASIAGDSINIQILQKLYRHSSITTTINYQANFVHKDFDEALDSVLNF